MAVRAPPVRTVIILIRIMLKLGIIMAFRQALMVGRLCPAQVKIHQQTETIIIACLRITIRLEILAEGRHTITCNHISLVICGNEQHKGGDRLAVYGIKDNKSLEPLLVQRKAVGVKNNVRNVDFDEITVEEGATYLIHVYTSLGTSSGMKSYQTSLEWLIDGNRYENESGDREYVIGSSSYEDASNDVSFSEMFIMTCPDSKINGIRFSARNANETYAGNVLYLIRID